MIVCKIIVMICRGGSRIFSRGGADFQSTVFPLLWQKFLRRRQIFEKTVKKAVFGHFLKNFDKKIAFFFGARSPSKLVYIGAKGAFRKILGSVGQKWISEKVSKGGPFGSAGGRIPEKGASAPSPPPPKSAPDDLYVCL